MTEADVQIGTMGWSYEDWRGPFYEANLAAAKMLEQYARTFSTVELDTTFYGVPRPSTLSGWQAATPHGFLFSAKAPRAITHERRLVESSDLANDFGNLLQKHLGEKLGALLLQLPPDYSAENRTAFEAFINQIAAQNASEALPWVVEFRHGSWAQTDVGAFLAARHIAVATTERLDLGGPLRYLRLLGIENSVARFDAKQFDQTEAVNAWAERIKAACQGADETGEKPAPVLVYVRNFFEGHAPATIAALRARLGLPEITPPGQQQMSLF